ncbi:MAG: geranylgeranyl reductase family protein, partial [Desulfatiglandales bacterium]|nr:geranylgeranyl reductase family protein [Desulfatiglandales bacterium]
MIGAGPAGATAAKSAAEAGAKTILMEKRKQVGVPVQCAEYVPHQMTQEVKLPEEVIAQRIDCMRTHMPDGEVVETAVRGFMIHRDFFDQHLADEAAKAGAGLLEAEAKEYKGGTVFALTKAGPLEIEAKLVVGADGPHSTAGKWINAQNKEFIQTAQHQMPLVSESKSTEVYFRKDIPVGYGWVFPKGKRANVGVGVNVQFGESPLKALRHFEGYLQQEGVIGNEVIKTIGGAIPVGGLV